MTILHVYHTASAGGVGMYLLTVSRELRNRGHRVLVATPEGTLEPAFTDTASRHIAMKMKGLDFFSAVGNLKKTIKAECVDIVCAHDYTASAPASVAARKTKHPFLLTVHARRPWWQRYMVFSWSSPVLALSPTIRNDLTTMYDLPPGQVIVTRIPVDVERFSPIGSEDPHIPPADHVVLHISRFSKTKSDTAIALANAVPALIQRHPRLSILLVGDGESSPQVARTAERINTATGRPVVRWLGERRDIPALMRRSSLVVGSATVALEAMATARPVIASGKCGFMGIVTPESFDRIDTSMFGDHDGPGTVSSQMLTDAILPLLGNRERCKELGKWGRHLIETKFSAVSVVDELEHLYSKAFKSN